MGTDPFPPDSFPPGNGPWSATFTNYEGHIGSFNIGAFESPGATWFGASGGIWGSPPILPVGGVVTDTYYILVIGGR